MQLSVIHNKIFEIQGQKIMLDFDLAELYEVETKVLNQAVKRNEERFPKDFMFRLTVEEWQDMRSQIVTASPDKRNTKATPFAFTEHGVTMLASVLRSEKAIKMNIAIVRAFVALRQFAINYKELAEQIKELKGTVDNHNGQLNQIYNALENLLDEKVSQKKWQQREPIGFKPNRKKK
ncbi:MAG TPA: ORF6N domain-containing protein [Chitinophagaceae bacterium]|nr:ORF6N domain-containing protein [Chitinophagaceae bacterium]